jgi:hypothetical protein
MRHCEPDALPTKVANVPAVHEKEGALVGAEPVGMFEPVGCRRAGDEGASPTRADGSDAANLPTGWDEKQAVQAVEKERKPLGLVAREQH